MEIYQPKSSDNFQALNLGTIASLDKIKEFVSKEQWKEAVKLASQINSADLTDANSLSILADVFTKNSDYPAALKIFHQMLDNVDEKDPRMFEVYKNMGNLYLKCGDIDAAEEKYNLANAINSSDENLIINYGVLAIQKGHYQEAKDRFAQVIEKNSSSDLAWVGIALVHRAHADHDLARACLLRGLDENPYNKMAITNYYQWCYQDGVDAPDSFLAQYLEKFPEDIEMQKLTHGLHQ